MRTSSILPIRNKIEQTERKHLTTNLVGTISNYGSIDDTKSNEVSENPSLALNLSPERVDEEEKKIEIDNSEELIPLHIINSGNYNNPQPATYQSYITYRRILCSSDRFPSLLFNESIPNLSIESRNKILTDLFSILGLTILINNSTPSITSSLFTFFTNTSSIAIEKLVPSPEYKNIKNKISNLKILLLIIIFITSYQSSYEMNNVSQIMRYILIIVNSINILLNIK